MAKGQKIYTEEFKNTIVELYNSGKSLAELSREYALSRSTINGWVSKAIIDIHKASKYRYGAHKIHASLKSNGITISIKKSKG